MFWIPKTFKAHFLIEEYWAPSAIDWGPSNRHWALSAAEQVSHAQRHASTFMIQIKARTHAPGRVIPVGLGMFALSSSSGISGTVAQHDNQGHATASKGSWLSEGLLLLAPCIGLTRFQKSGCPTETFGNASKFMKHTGIQRCLSIPLVGVLMDSKGIW